MSKSATPFNYNVTINLRNQALTTVECLVQTGLYGNNIQEAAERIFFRQFQTPELLDTLFHTGMYDRPTYAREVAQVTAAISSGNIGSQAGTLEAKLSAARVAAVREYLVSCQREKLAALPSGK